MSETLAPCRGGRASLAVAAGTADSFAQVAAFAAEAVVDWPRRDALRLVLVLEELFTNSVDHGGEGACRLRLSLRRRGREVVVGYADRGRKFDPRTLAMAADAAPDRPGGVGLRLINHYAPDIAYRRHRGRNVLRFRMSPATADGAGSGTTKGVS